MGFEDSVKVGVNPRVSSFPVLAPGPLSPSAPLLAGHYVLKGDSVNNSAEVTSQPSSGAASSELCKRPKTLL